MKKLKLLLYYFFSFFIMLVPSLILLLIIKLISKFLLIRFGQMPSDRIGHLALDIELYLCKLQKTKLKKKTKDIFFIPNKYQICNKYLLNIWQKKLTIVKKFFIIPLWIIINSKIFNFFFKNHLIKHRSIYFPHLDFENLIPNSKQNIFIKIQDQEECQNILKKNNIDINKKFICLHVRDNFYLKKKYPKKDFQYHDYRDFELSSFEKLCKYFEEKNFLIFRMGNATLKKMNFANNNIIDYSNSSFLSDKMDVYLISKCSIFIGAESGLLSLAQCFRKPSLEILGKPIVPATHFRTLYCFRNLCKISNEQVVSIKEVISNNLYGKVYDMKVLKSKGYYFKDLSQEEIYQYGIDIYDFYNNNFNFSESENTNQKSFYNNFLNNIKFCKPYVENLQMNFNKKNLAFISPSFLKNYPMHNN